ncbi:unnamed protein product [Oikopleura dioica]|uniref:Endonuclease/exonuclease/phosphatase domain-containing protein n=1 Tax=Oikopleura dioica TaxID=34765 RepID=E4XI52_OIKDI|nr:unnamed protein product [Oikopleura dioica]
MDRTPGQRKRKAFESISPLALEETITNGSELITNESNSMEISKVEMTITEIEKTMETNLNQADSEIKKAVVQRMRAKRTEDEAKQAKIRKAEYEERLKYLALEQEKKNKRMDTPRPTKKIKRETQKDLTKGLDLQADQAQSTPTTRSRAKGKIRYKPKIINSPIEMTRAQTITQEHENINRTWNLRVDTPQTVIRNRQTIFLDPMLLEKQKQHSCDNRSRAQYLKDLETFKKTLINNPGITMEKDETMECPWSKDKKGKSTNKKKETFEELVMFLNAEQGYLTPEEFVRGYEIKGMPNSKNALNNRVNESLEKRQNMTKWFTRPTRNKKYKLAKDRYLSAVYHSANTGLVTINKLLNEEENDNLKIYGLTSPDERNKLVEFKEQLIKLSEVISNPHRLSAIYSTHTQILDYHVPIPSSEALVDLMLDIQTESYPTSSKSKAMVKFLLAKHGVKTAEMTIDGEEKRIVMGGPGPYREDQIPILVATRHVSEQEISPKKEKLIIEMIRNIIALNTKLNYDEIQWENLDPVWKDKTGRKILMEIVKIEKFHPKGLKYLLKEEFNAINFNNRVFRQNSKTDDCQKTELELQQEKQARLDMRRGKIPKGRIPDEDNCKPETFIKFPFGRFNRVFGKIKSALGNIKQDSTKTNKNFKKKLNGIIKVGAVKSKELERSKVLEMGQKAQLENPSKEEINNLMQVANELNKSKANNHEKIGVISTNPGQTNATIFRKLAELDPDTHIFLINEMRTTKEIINDKTCHPNGYNIVANMTSPDGYIYTCIMYKESLQQYIKQIDCAGNSTGIDLECAEKLTKRFISTYRHNNRDETACHYITNYNRNKMLFAEWISDHTRQAKKDKVILHLGGDWNIDLSGKRTEDNKKLIEALIKATEGMTNLITRNSHFRKNVAPSKIDYFFVGKPDQTKIKALGWHKAPAFFDGHTSHKVTLPFGKPLKQYEVKVNRKIDRASAYNYTLANYTKWQTELDAILDGHERANKSFEIVNEILHKNSIEVAKITTAQSQLKQSIPSDTWAYRKAADMIQEQIDKRPEQTEIRRELEIALIKVNVICKKMFNRDSENRAKKITETANGGKTTFWEIVKELTKTHSNLGTTSRLKNSKLNCTATNICLLLCKNLKNLKPIRRDQQE